MLAPNAGWYKQKCDAEVDQEFKIELMLLWFLEIMKDRLCMHGSIWAKPIPCVLWAT